MHIIKLYGWAGLPLVVFNSFPTTIGGLFPSAFVGKHANDPCSSAGDDGTFKVTSGDVHFLSSVISTQHTWQACLPSRLQLIPRSAFLGLRSFPVFDSAVEQTG